MKIIKENKKNIPQIISALKKGAVLVCPTDTVYGLICDAENKTALEKIFLIKKRDKSKPLLIFVDSLLSASKIALLSERQKKFLENIWPGQITIIVKTKKFFSNLICQNKTIGLRVPKYSFLNLILKRFKKPLAQTSANISGQGATTKIKEVIEQFKDKEIQPDFIINAGDLPTREPSIIIDITDNKIRFLR